MKSFQFLVVKAYFFQCQEVGSHCLSFCLARPLHDTGSCVVRLNIFNCSIGAWVERKAWDWILYTANPKGQFELNSAWLFFSEAQGSVSTPPLHIWWIQYVVQSASCRRAAVVYAADWIQAKWKSHSFRFHEEMLNTGERGRHGQATMHHCLFSPASTSWIHLNRSWASIIPRCGCLRRARLFL